MDTGMLRNKIEKKAYFLRQHLTVADLNEDPWLVGITFSPLWLALVPYLKNVYLPPFNYSWRSVCYPTCDIRVDIASGLRGLQCLGLFG